MNKIKKLLPEHIVGYLLHGLKVRDIDDGSTNTLLGLKLINKDLWLYYSNGTHDRGRCEPLLKPLKSLTPEELNQFSICFRLWYDKDDFDYRQMAYSDIEMCHKLHVDYRDLIGNGLAIEK